MLLTPKQIFTRLGLYVLTGVSLGTAALEITFRIKGVGAAIDNRSLIVEWKPSPLEWHKENDFNVWLRPGTGRIEYRSDLNDEILLSATHSITPQRTRGATSPAPRAGVKRILALGDSVTFGQGVNDDQTFLHHFDAQSDDYDVLNAAVPTWGLVQYESYIRNIAPMMNPNEILLFFYVNDFMQPDYYYDAEPLTKMRLSEVGWANDEKGLRRYSFVFNHLSRLKHQEKLHREALSGHNSYLQLIQTRSQFSRGKKALENIGERCKQYDWRCTLVTLPLLEDAAIEHVEFVLDKATEYALAADLNVIRLENSLQGIHVYDRWLFPCDQHLSPYAHEKIAAVFSSAHKELFPTQTNRLSNDSEE